MRHFRRVFTFPERGQGSTPDFRGRRWPSWRAQRAIFSRISPFLVLKSEKIARFLALCASVGTVS